MTIAVEFIRAQGAAATGVLGAISIWARQTKSTLHIPVSEAASLSYDDPRITSLLNSEQDLYVSNGIRKLGLASHQAGKHVDLVGILGFGLDIDAWGPLRAHGNLPQTKEDVYAILGNCLPPTLIISTGTGESIHAWWIFDKPKLIKDSSDLKKLRLISKNFHEQFHDRAKKLGFHLDATDKLNQWLRLPGTKNWKGVHAKSN